MKNIYIYLSLLAVIVLGTACNNEWEDEQYEQYVSFKAPIASGSDGVTTIYVRYKDNGKVTYQLPIIVSGSTVNSQDRDIHIAVDKDPSSTMVNGKTHFSNISMSCKLKSIFNSSTHEPAGICTVSGNSYLSSSISVYHNSGR